MTQQHWRSCNYIHSLSYLRTTSVVPNGSILRGHSLYIVHRKCPTVPNTGPWIRYCRWPRWGNPAQDSPSGIYFLESGRPDESTGKKTSDSSLKNSWAAHGPGNSNRLEIVFEELFLSKRLFADKIRSERMNFTEI